MADSIKALPNCSLFELLASCGLRISEPLGLRLGDVTNDGLVLPYTKFNKSQLLPMHRATAIAHQQVTLKRCNHEVETAIQSIEFTDYTSAL
ncbi:MAG: tyrosine-type recombinase/integrase [candidate division Zixibacteria bacterium]|nr:tyrosine-type recombinase/integrase [candidate division Zixibacteria bacterium]